MHETYIAHPTDLILSQQQGFSQITKTLTLCLQTLAGEQQKLNASKKILGCLKPEFNLLETKLSSLKNKIEKSLLLSTAHNDDLSAMLNLLFENDEKLANKQEEKNNLILEKNKVINVWMHGNQLLQEKSNIYLVKMALKHSDSIGTGIDIIEHEANPLAEIQIQSLEDEIQAIDAATALLHKEKETLDSQAFIIIEQKKRALQEVQSKLNVIHNKLKLVQDEIHEREILKEVAETNSLPGAAMRGDINQVNQFLLSGSVPNQINEYGKKPLYYAVRGGHADLVIQLVDYTDLSKIEEDELIQVLPTYDKESYARILASIKSNKNLYDHLWNINNSLGDNIKNIFEDYYSPAILKRFQIVPDQMKRFLTLHWNRQHVDIAQDIVTIFSKIEPELKKDHILCQKLIEGKWRAFFELDPPPNKNSSLGRRLHYVKNKLEPRLENTSTLSTSPFALHTKVDPKPFSITNVAKLGFAHEKTPQFMK